MRIGTVAYSTDQGISHLAKWFYDEGVITDVMTFRHGSRPEHPEWYPPGTTQLVGRPFNGPVVDEFLKKVDLMLFFENPFDWDFLQYCRDRNVKTAIVPMYECTPARYTPSTKEYDGKVRPDRWICPSLLDVQYFPGSPYLPIPLPRCLPPWKLRTTAKRFLHNGGNLGLRGHKGTLELMRAMQLVKSPIQLTIRAQDEAGLHRLCREVPTAVRDERITFQYGTIPYEKLFDEDHDVFIMVEKYNGLSLPLAEAKACGMPVMTTDRFPTNTFLDHLFLIPVASTTPAKVGGPYNTYQEAIVDLQDVADAIDRAYENGEKTDQVERISLNAKQWRETMSWDELKPRWIKELESI